MAATSSAYQTVTILALLIGSALIIMLGILYTQNQQKWGILARGALIGPVSKLVLIAPNNGIATGNGFQVQDNIAASTGREQFSSYILATDPNKPYNAVTSPAGRFLVTMQKPPVQYP